MAIRPLHDQVVIKPDEKESVSSGGIMLTGTTQETSGCGTVIAIGKGKMLNNGEIVPSDLKAGDKVVYGQYAGTKIELNGVEHLVMKESKILFVTTD